MTLLGKKLNWQFYYAVILFIIAISIPVTIIYSAVVQNHLANQPVDVLTNWSLTIDNSVEYRLGDNIAVESRFNKIRNVNGTAYRYIQCLQTSFADQGLAKVRANKDAEIPTNWWDGKVVINITTSGQATIKNNYSSYNLTIPTTIMAPNVCRVYVNVVYNVNKYNPAFSEYVYSKSFVVNPASSTSSVTMASPSAVIYTEPSAKTQPNVINIPSSPSSNSFVDNNSDPQPTQESAPANTNSTGLLQSVISGVDNLLSGL